MQKSCPLLLTLFLPKRFDIQFVIWTIPETPREEDIQPKNAMLILPTYLTEFSLPYRATLLSPPFSPHAFLDAIPDPLNYFSIPPPPLHTHMCVPLLDLGAHNAPAPPLDCSRHILAAPSYIDAQYVLEQFRRTLPPIALELPRLTCGEYRHDAAPVVRLELLRRVDKNESQSALRVYGRKQP